ncbi:MAG: SMC-Scp complex subunit ScpB [Candidatus Zixiibacteriota bacterium]
MKTNEKKIIEVLIFASPEPIQSKLLAEVADIPKDQVSEVVGQLNSDYERTGRTFRIKKLAGGYTLYTLPDFSKFLEQAFPEKNYPHLTRSMIEVLAVIAMEQPVTKKYIEKIRGTDCAQQIRQLMKLGFITPVSRMNTPGRPYLLGTTKSFLKHFGLSRIEDIPTISELKELLD